MTRVARSLAPALLLAIGALALSPVPSLAQKIKKERDRVTREEILAAGQGDQDLFTALRMLRPRFVEPPPGVRTLGNSMEIPTAVVIDGKRMGGLETLQSVVASTVEEVRYLEPSRAGTEFGKSASGGAVVIKLYREPPKTKAVADSLPRKPER
jgi:hypothetical protein